MIEIAPTDFKSAQYAVRNWHYSGTMPAGKTAKYGIWEDLRFIGVIIFSRGANKHLLLPYGLTQLEGCELTRVAIRDHKAPVTQMLAMAIRELKKDMPGMRIIVSYADQNQGHLGTIYQAGNWLYMGETAVDNGLIVHGKLTHRRSLNSKYGRSGLTWIRENVDKNAQPSGGLKKFKYVYPLDKQMRRKILKIAEPYPSAVSIDGNAASVQVAVAGSTPAPRSS